ncbi:PREDICTED: dehydrogenase/reductase SDR family protein 7-like [Nicrophorus vespilloides]|uniref:Dehydrogenase/reductase SDR family protein 7-like n=1 Tax=Nicrophorus vespilloides TaxID=110193 RepID=A0ABM1NHK4_NICVS|nr:PREDICTED: dehydrogenase/reductase SDR family protein 7-like [Nicrophorus vespilloides]
MEEKRTMVWNIASSIGIALTIPYILYKVVRAVYIKKVYGALAGKVVVITGASSGLGEALAHEFYKNGCQVVLCARRRQELDRVRMDLLKMHPTVPTLHPIIVPLDLGNLDQLPSNVDKIIALTGHIDILINNGGISNRGSACDTKLSVDMELMKINYFGTITLTKAVLPSMVKRNQGHIVSISSVQGLIAIPERSSYSASKHALQAFSDSLRAEVNKHNIHMTVVSPGYIKTQLSLNALTGTGAKHGQLDKNTEQGYTPEFVANKILNSVVQGKKEVVIASFIARIGIFLRKYFPTIYFLVMAHRANKSH